MKISNRKKLQLKVLVDLRYIYTRIDKQLVKKKRIKTKFIERPFEVFNTDGIKNREVTRLLKLEINEHTEKIDIMVIDLNGIDIFLEYNWLVKHNPGTKRQCSLQDI